MTSAARLSSTVTSKYFSDLDSTRDVMDISMTSRRAAETTSPTHRKAWLLQTISMTSLLADYTSQLEEKLREYCERYQRARDRDLDYTMRLYEQYAKVKSPTASISSTDTPDGKQDIPGLKMISDTLQEWEGKVISTISNEDGELLKTHQKYMTVFERFQDENPNIDSGGLDDSLIVDTLVCRDGFLNIQNVFQNGIDLGNAAFVDKVVKTFVARLHKYKYAVEGISKIFDSLRITEQLVLAERFKEAQVKRFVIDNGSLEVTETKTSPVTSKSSEMKKACETLFVDQEHILERCHAILSSMKDSGGKLQTCTKDLVAKTKCLLDCCSKLESYEKQWSSATSLYTTSDPVAYVKKNYDVKNCLNMSLKDHDKRLKSLKKLLERQSVEHSKNVQQILSKWKECYETQNSADKTVAISEESLTKFIEDCRGTFDEKTAAVKKMKEDSESNCSQLAEYIRKIYELDEAPRLEGDKMIEQKKPDSTQLDEFYMDYVENVERYRQSFDIISQSADLYLKYLSTFEKRVTSYNSAETKLKSSSEVLIKELENAEHLETQLKDGRSLIQSMESDLFGRKDKVDKVKGIFLALRNVEERCTAVLNETTEKRKDVDQYSDRLSSGLKAAQDRTKRHVDIMERWRLQTKDSKLSRILASVENDDFKAVLDQHHANKAGGLDYCKSLLEDQQESLREAAIQNSARCNDFLEELSNIFRIDANIKSEVQQCLADQKKYISQWQDYIATKRRSFPLIEEAITRKLESIAEFFPQINSSRRVRPLEDRNGSGATGDELDKFYSDRFCRKAKDINSQLAQAKRSVEELSLVVEKCADICSSLAKCEDESNKFSTELNSSLVNEYLEESRKHIASAFCSLNELRKKYTDRQKATGGLKDLVFQMQRVAQKGNNLVVDVDEAVEELKERCCRLERVNKDFETSYRSQESSIRKLNLDVHQQRVMSVGRDIEERSRSKKMYSRKSIDDQVKWMNECRNRVEEYSTKNSLYRQQLEDLLDAACRECNEREMERINTSGLDRYTDERKIDPEDYVAKVKVLSAEYEAIFSKVVQICPIIRRRTSSTDNIYKHYIECIPQDQNSTDDLDNLARSFTTKADDLQKTIKTVLRNKMKELQESFEEAEKERLRLGDLRDKVSDSGISRDFDSCRQDLMELERRLNSCKDQLGTMSEGLAKVQETSSFDEGDSKRLEAIERILAASNSYEKLGLTQPNGWLHDRYTKADISRAFREQSKLVHPDKCKLPDAELASRLLSEAKIELEKYKFRP